MRRAIQCSRRGYDAQANRWWIRCLVFREYYGFMYDTRGEHMRHSVAIVCICRCTKFSHSFLCDLIRRSVESLVWGLPVSYGGKQHRSMSMILTHTSVVFLAAYLKDPVFANQPHAASLLPLIGPLCTGLMYISGGRRPQYSSHRPF